MTRFIVLLANFCILSSTTDASSNSSIVAAGTSSKGSISSSSPNSSSLSIYSSSSTYSSASGHSESSYASASCCSASCPKNEVRSKCVQAVCRAQNCTQKGSPITCPVVAKISCKKDCVCARGFLRNSSGKCIPENKCIVPTCGENEFYSECSNGCDPVNCPKSFKEEQDRLANCVAPAVCLPPDCRCLRNFRRDENGKCIYIGKCPGICPAYEEFSNCTQALCRAQNYSQLGQSTGCPTVEEGSCQSGCVCEEGAFRDKNGNCVLEEQCKVY